MITKHFKLKQWLCQLASLTIAWTVLLTVGGLLGANFNRGSFTIHYLLAKH